MMILAQEFYLVDYDDYDEEDDYEDLDAEEMMSDDLLDTVDYLMDEDEDRDEDPRRYL
jgi:hypothetical protein